MKQFHALLVDDDEIMAARLSDLVSAAGYDVVK